jgi:hypothetical protein
MQAHFRSVAGSASGGCGECVIFDVERTVPEVVEGRLAFREPEAQRTSTATSSFMSSAVSMEDSPSRPEDTTTGGDTGVHLEMMVSPVATGTSSARH